MSREAAEFIVNTSLETIPPQVVSQAKLHILDTIGTTVGGFKTKAGQIAARFAEGLGRSPQSTIMLSSTKASMTVATFANCVAASALDYDDGHMGCGLHPGSVIVPPALAVGEAVDCSGKDLLEAVVVGYEVGLRAGLMLTRRAGHIFPHSTGGMGAFTAAAAAAKLLRLNAGQSQQALGIAACTLPMGIFGGMADIGPMTKEQIGWGGMAGVAAAVLAQKGYTGGFTPFNARVDGRAEHPYYPFDGVTWEILKTYFKSYPACRHNHAPLDMLFRLLHEQRLNKGDVVRVVVETGLGASRLNNPQPISLEHAQYSIPFNFGAALVYGKVRPDTTGEDRLNDPAILEQAVKVHVQPNPEMEQLYPRYYPAIMHLETTDGRVYTLRKHTATGDYDDPMTAEQVQEKFREQVVPAVGRQSAEKAIALVNNLEQVRSVREVVDLLRAKVPVA
ncbi:MAG: MmgE/PrpD family protein [Chloroflexi bacterium]|nr:MmgE/PrpD family protein [Chloroflexota bacterium]